VLKDYIALISLSDITTVNQSVIQIMFRHLS